MLRTSSSLHLILLVTACHLDWSAPGALHDASTGQGSDRDGSAQEDGGASDGGHADDGGTSEDPKELNPPRHGAIEAVPVSCESSADAGGFTFEKIAVWRDDATAAYSLIHDELCGPELREIDRLAVPALRLRGLLAGFGPYVQACEDGALWSMVSSVAEAGHEIVNHSYTNQSVTPDNAAREVTEAKQVLENRTGAEVGFYAFPNDVFSEATIALVAAAGHAGARAGYRDDNDAESSPPINPAEPGNDLEVEFDVWPRVQSKYLRYQPRDVLLVHLHNAIERGGWAVRELHSISTDAHPPEDGSQGAGPVPLRTYEEHLDDLVAAWKSNEVWTAPPSTVLRYRRARTACKASVSGDAISFDATNADCTRYATPLSVIVKTANDVNSLEATQAGVPLSTRKIGAKTFSVNADPTLGVVRLRGCGDPGPEVDPSFAPPARPTPAVSVCDLETVRGEGGAGKMDDFEREASLLQSLPNPAQADGRTGSWTSSPAAVQAAIVEQDDNSVLRFSGGGLNVFSGVTLAFLGASGAGTCYDASAYRGIRFKIRGAVASADALANKVLVSFVTAETQSQAYGGDLNGEGGHFYEVVSLSDSFTLVEVPFADLDRPGWGDTTSLTHLSAASLQAVDWSVTNNATSFDIELDDIELY